MRGLEITQSQEAKASKFSLQGVEDGSDVVSNKSTAAAKVTREDEKEERKMKARAKAEELAATRAPEEQQREAATSQRSCNVPNGSRRKVSQLARVQKNRQSVVVVWVLEIRLGLHRHLQLHRPKLSGHDQYHP